MILIIDQILTSTALCTGDFECFGRTRLIGFINSLQIPHAVYRHIAVAFAVGRLDSRSNIQRVSLRIVLVGAQRNIRIAFQHILWNQTNIGGLFQGCFCFGLDFDAADKSGLYIAGIFNNRAAGITISRNGNRIICLNAERELEAVYHGSHLCVDYLHILPERFRTDDRDPHLFPYSEDISLQRFHIALDFHVPVPVLEIDCTGGFGRENAVQPLPVTFDVTTQDKVNHNIPLFNSGRIEERSVNSRTRACVDRGRRAGKPLNICNHIVLRIMRQLKKLSLCVFYFQCKKAEHCITSPT